MFNFLRKVIKDWLFNEEKTEESDLYLDCHVNKDGKPQVARFHIQGVVGFRLIGICEGETRLLSEGSAVDPKRFSEVRGQFSSEEFFWEDGTKAKI